MKMVLDFDAIRSVCIKQSLFTKGTNAQWEQTLSYWKNTEFDASDTVYGIMEVLERLAHEVLYYSDADHLMKLSGMGYYELEEAIAYEFFLAGRWVME